jgi:hypothetical protein
MTLSEHDPYATGPNFLPQSMVKDPMGPLNCITTVERETKYVQKYWLMIRFHEMSGIEDDFARIASQMLCFTKATRGSLKNWVTKGLPVPDCTQIIAQPFIRIRTSCGIWAVSGPRTGEIASWKQNTSVQYQAMNKTWIMHYTVWLGAAILDPLRILIQPDVKFEGYVAGMDDTMIRQERWMPSNIEFSTLGSAFVFACGATFSRPYARKEANPLCLMGTYDRRYLQNNYAAQSVKSTKAMWPSFHFYNMLWNFTEINSGITDATCDSYKEKKESNYLSGIMPIATHKTYNESTLDYSVVYEGTGHLDIRKSDGTVYLGPLKDILSGKIQFQRSMK